jgi:hypothetical protein
LSVVRYAIAKLSLPYFTKWVQERFDVVVKDGKSTRHLSEPKNIPSPIVDAGIIEGFGVGLVLIMRL